MFLLERVHLVQFFLFQAQTLELDRTTAVIAPNGAGKSALLDALQIVLLGGDRNQIRFNAQAGGNHRARTIRDYCLGVYRTGDDGRARRTATTYISLVFRDEATGEPLTAGIALGASADEPDHRVNGLYLLPHVDLALDDHLEQVDGHELPLEWARFRELISRRCKDHGTTADLHASSDRFVKELLHRLRPSPTAHLDAGAWRKAFRNALNLQRVDDVDLFVRTLVAEERPTDIGRFRALLDGFRQIKERIEQVARRIDEAEAVDAQYRKVASLATRASSYRALAAEYRRDAHGEAVDAAEQALQTANDQSRQSQRALDGARSGLRTAEAEWDEAKARLQVTPGHNEQSSFDGLATRDREELARLKKSLMRDAVLVRDLLQAATKLQLPTLDASLLQTAIAPWQSLYDSLASLHGDAAIPADPEALHARLHEALRLAEPVVRAVAAHDRDQHNAIDAAHDRVKSLRANLERLGAGKAELRPDVLRLLNYLQEEGIPARPVCDLVRVTDRDWQPAIEAYLRTHVEALLVPPEHEERAVRFVRGLHGSRAVYGAKLALASHARRQAAATPPSDTVAALLDGDDADALAYLRRQLGDVRRVDTDAEVVQSRHGLSRDGLLAKGGGVERLRLPAAGELRIGAANDRERQRLLRGDLEAAIAEHERLQRQARPVADCAAALARLGNADEVAGSMHTRLLEHREAVDRLDRLRESQAAFANPDLLRLTEHAEACRLRVDTLRQQVEDQLRAVTRNEEAVKRALAALDELNTQTDAIARAAIEAFADPDVDPNLVERHRDELDEKQPDLVERLTLCAKRAQGADHELANLLPEAWRGLSQYGKDHGLPIDLEPQDWRAADKLLRKDIDHLRGTELVEHQAAAEEAYTTAVSTFRSNVASALYDNFTRLRHQVETLNRTLSRSPAFSNNERYRFRYDVLPELRELHAFIKRAAEVGESDNLFGTAGKVPAAFRELIEDQAGPARPSPLDDYRRFFHFEVDIRQEDRVIGTLSERMRSGSGGEHRAPLYVIAGAALAAAYGKAEGQTGGIGVIMLDEFGDKIDAQNARATTHYLRSLGLQLVLAAPDTAQGTLTGVLDSYIELFRDGGMLQVEQVRVREAGRELLESDQFAIHPELLEREVERIVAEQADVS
ncbi:hypothetical protein N800_09000 [Lysobacter daejeonensis GH1-9]|uniref:SMC hinge domain-containing protein n=1 Tax=Lysobacter daejeonensis GH1-9 TaxID=1385517 RepID=A0A0A0EZH0_9GAMM|nr:SbcC/MukB-like Walker B domain-containing protein [Lysobacter daejeonensis]KGM56321.1 hypothetical protein N800_09000 [Lysobacter daejeonensis GH1-9]